MFVIELATAGKPVSLESVSQRVLEASGSSSLNEKPQPSSSKDNVLRSRNRNIYHPLFANLDYKGAEERLLREGKGTGEVRSETYLLFGFITSKLCNYSWLLGYIHFMLLIMYDY